MKWIRTTFSGTFHRRMRLEREREGRGLASLVIYGIIVKVLCMRSVKIAGCLQFMMIFPDFHSATGTSSIKGFRRKQSIMFHYGRSKLMIL